MKDKTITMYIHFTIHHFQTTQLNPLNRANIDFVEKMGHLL